MQDRDSLFFEKEAVRATSSERLRQLLSGPVESTLLLAHIRLATKGSIELPNTHPFVKTDRYGNAWTLIHNGTIFENSELDAYIRYQNGTTDSERILCCLFDRLEAAGKATGRVPSEGERIAIVEQLLLDITPENKVNLLLTDGVRLYAHTNYRESLHIKRGDASVLISTNPLQGGGWEELPLNTLVVFRDGGQLYEGQSHENEFFDSEEKMRLLYLDYAGI